MSSSSRAFVLPDRSNRSDSSYILLRGISRPLRSGLLGLRRTFLLLFLRRGGIYACCCSVAEVPLFLCFVRILCRSAFYHGFVSDVLVPGFGPFAGGVVENWSRLDVIGMLACLDVVCLDLVVGLYVQLGV